MMDIDDALRQVADELGAEDLHVAGEHDQIHVRRFEEGELGALLRRFRVGRDGKCSELDAELARDGLEVRMVAHDEGDVAPELARSVAKQEVVQAMIVLRYEDGDASPAVRVRKAVLHSEPLRDLVNAVLERDAIGVKLSEVEVNSL